MSRLHILIPIVIVTSISLIAGAVTINNRVKAVDSTLQELKLQVANSDTIDLVGLVDCGPGKIVGVTIADHLGGDKTANGRQVTTVQAVVNDTDRNRAQIRTPVRRNQQVQLTVACANQDVSPGIKWRATAHLLPELLLVSQPINCNAPPVEVLKPEPDGWFLVGCTWHQLDTVR